MFCTRYNLILQASVCPLVCVPEEYTIRGEVRREEVADLLAAVIQALVLQQPLMAHSSLERELQLGPSWAVCETRHMSQTKPKYEKYLNQYLPNKITINLQCKFVKFLLDLQWVFWKFVSLSLHCSLILF